MHSKNIKKKEKLIKQLEDLFDSKFEKVFEGVHEGFAYSFSKLDIKGVERFLRDYNTYDGVTKNHYVRLIEKTFNKLKRIGITSLDVVPGTCNGCINGCSGYSFIDPKTGVYIDIIIELENCEIINFMECYDLKNTKDLLKKRERIVIKQYKGNYLDK